MMTDGTVSRCTPIRPLGPEAGEQFPCRVSLQADTPDTGGAGRLTPEAAGATIGGPGKAVYPAGDNPGVEAESAEGGNRNSGRFKNAAEAKAGLSSGLSAASDPKIVTHFIAGFPTYEASLEVARGLIAGGAFALEMQIPFSDPSADGPVIESACNTALEGGFTVSDAFRLLSEIRAESDIPIFIMSYASLVVTPGVAEFSRRAKAAGASGLIIPDLAPGADEGLYAAAADAGCPAVPVVVPWITDKRLEEILAEPLEWIYVALRSGITGTYTELGAEQESFLMKLRGRQLDRECGGAGNGSAGGITCGGNAGSSAAENRSGGPRVMAGFGIQRPEQVAAVVRMADAAIVGSALVNVIAAAWSETSDPKKTGEAARKLTEELRG